MADSPYIIRFIQLSPGDHAFDFRIDDSFFDHREESIIRRAAVEVQAVLHKTANSMSLDLKFSGEVAVDCVRCLEPFSMPVDFQRNLLVRLVEQPSEEEDDEDAIQVSKTAHDIDLSRALYDFLTLAVPYSPVHPDREDGSLGCDPEVLQHLFQGGSIEEHPNGEAEGDDRWSILRKIKFN